MKPHLKYLRDEAIDAVTRQRIREYESKTNVTVTLPVPVEQIVEQVLGLDFDWDAIEELPGEQILGGLDAVNRRVLLNEKHTALFDSKPGLLRSTIDPKAEFLFVPADQGMQVAERERATPYDVPNVEFGHHGQECSFDAFVRKHGLTGDPALVLLAKIVNGADTDNSLWNQPEAAGLNAVAEGFRHLGFQNDHELIAAESIVYDALYAYCPKSLPRRQVEPCRSTCPPVASLLVQGIERRWVEEAALVVEPYTIPSTMMVRRGKPDGAFR